ncbi:MAG: DUF3089 domain-containing protein [Deltaproteobacteria bacterium]|nr:DUF3089 domain-containing protein [Deltaproteobacteria bacterium]
MAVSSSARMATAGALLAACLGAACEPCKPPPATAPDYATDQAWICRPGIAGDVCGEDLSAVEVMADGSTALVGHVPAVEPAAACFWVYPTVDLALSPGVHADLSDRAGPEAAVRGQGARFTEVCSVHAPAYRQATLGVYGSTNQEVRDRCFEVAIGDVLAAFDQFLADIGDMPFVVGGHSQGAHMTTEVLRRKVEPDDALLARLVVALPIGWPVGTPSALERVGGTFERVPLCAEPDELGCAMAFRSYGEGNPLPRDPTSNKLAGLFMGESVACTNPVEEGGTLSRAYFPTSNPFLELPAAAKDSGAPYALYRDAFTARCQREAFNSGLQIGVVDGVTAPLDFTRRSLSGDSGTHVLDLQFTQGDLIDLVGRKIAGVPARR